MQNIGFLLSWVSTLCRYSAIFEESRGDLMKILPSRIRKGLKIDHTDLAPFVFCESYKSMQTHKNALREPKKTSVSKSRGPPEWCEVCRTVLYKICKKCMSRARRVGAMRGVL